ncbi:putative competence protein F-like protein [Pandoraea horticolens]|uniref:Putative competence protein F-like protein n=1 Tax=Pandoraea horticolens TaxID=2508298 RepID=A0A5E4REY2_9BURK|nr:phosphoribosyltransferase family protein [Pandoraea horticolens]VVD61082.1 putative competence protein F-like protein [Pandoraea horticolens]
MLARLAGGLLRVALPDHCAVCRRRATRQVCSDCAQAFDDARSDAPLRCHRCAAALPSLAAPTEDATTPNADDATICRTQSPIVCGQCLRHRPAFDAALTLADYVAPLDMLMIRLKYQGALPFTREFGERLGDALTARGDATPLLVPVPLAPSRLASRGFNQAWELARVASRRANLPASAHVLRRERSTAAQQRLSREARRCNLRGAFVASDHARGRRIVLVDDVMTTGATCDAAAAALKHAGATHVLAAVVLRTPSSL